MLKKIPKSITPDLLSLLSKMGSGDELIICGENYPAYGLKIPNICHINSQATDLLRDILELFPLSEDVIPATMYYEEDKKSAAAEKYIDVIENSEEAYKCPEIDRLDKYPFENRAEKCFVAIITSDSSKGCELILTKGRV